MNCKQNREICNYIQPGINTIGILLLIGILVLISFITPVSNGTIIPFASEEIIQIIAGDNNEPMIPNYLGFGSSGEGMFMNTSASIDFDQIGNRPLNYAFSMPRDGEITSISAYFFTQLDADYTASQQIIAQLYAAEPGSNVFYKLTEATVELSPTLNGTVPANTILNGFTDNISIPVKAQTKLLLVFYVIQPDTTGTVGPGITGYAGAGVNII